MSGWKEQYLTQAGKEVLIKAVIQSIPSYVMQCFLLPKHLITEIEKMTSRFFWGAKEGERKIHWKSWEDCCKKKEQGGLGFRDLASFNLAMLAKQAWRILKYPTTLSSRLLKAKYFRNRNFIEAKCNSGSSFVWRSIVSGRDLLNEGLRWRIGNGEEVNVFRDPWIPNITNFTIGTIDDNLDEMKVNQLLNPGPKWNEDLITTLFPQYIAENILQLNLSPRPRADNLLWHFTSNGIYTVKSGYHVAYSLRRNDMERASSSSNSRTTTFWNKLWSLKIQPKVKHFLWRACTNSLPINTNLEKRGITDGRCYYCMDIQETTEHCLIQCTVAKRIWSKSKLIRPVMMRGSITDLIAGMFAELDESICNKAIYFLWFIWKSRCNAIFEGEDIYVSRILTQAATLAAEINEQVTKNENQPTPSWPATWTKPAPGFIKVNFDASIVENKLSVGGIIRNSEGNIIASFSYPLGGCHNVLLGEALALYHALTVALAHGCNHWIFEGDCLLLIQRLRSPTEDLSELRGILKPCEELFVLFSSITFSFVKRTGNIPAHLLARYGFDSLSFKDWDNHPPSDVIDGCAIDSA